MMNCSTHEITALDLSRYKWEIVTGEVLYSVENDPMLASAKAIELERWKEYAVYNEVEDEGQDFITVTWVVTEKQRTDDNKQVKARLVARGFEETNSDIRKDSPTCSKPSIRLVCSIANSNSWKIQSMDITAAFLQ